MCGDCGEDGVHLLFASHLILGISSTARPRVAGCGAEAELIIQSVATQGSDKAKKALRGVLR